MIIGLGNAVVNLKGVGLVECGTYKDGVVYCNDIHRKQWLGYKVELLTGLIQRASDQEREYCDNVFFLTEGDPPKYTYWVGQRQYRNTYAYQSFGGDNVWITQLILALTSHQVSGDQILKGLRVKGIKCDISKLTECFLGGWVITKDDQYISVDEMINACFTE